MPKLNTAYLTEQDEADIRRLLAVYPEDEELQALGARLLETHPERKRRLQAEIRTAVANARRRPDQIQWIWGPFGAIFKPGYSKPYGVVVHEYTAEGFRTAGELRAAMLDVILCGIDNPEAGEVWPVKSVAGV